MPCLPWVQVCRLIYREFNELADASARNALKRICSFYKELARMHTRNRRGPPAYLRIFVDGSHSKGIAASGWIIFGASEVTEVSIDVLASAASFCGELSKESRNDRVLPVWEPLVDASRHLGPSTIVNVELTAVEPVLDALQPLIQV